MHIGVDTHKKRHVLVALDERGQLCGTQSVANTPAGWVAALHWARDRDAIGWPWPVERYLLAARDLGRFGGAYATGRPVPDYPWLCGDHEASWFDRFAASAAAAMCDETWANPVLQAAFSVPVADRTQRLIAEHAAIRQRLARLPRVLCHHDSWSRNLFARVRGGREETVAIDWATVDPGPIIPRHRWADTYRSYI